jgi:hypothetical protein
MISPTAWIAVTYWFGLPLGSLNIYFIEIKPTYWYPLPTDSSKV